jgi:hypothetical protein
MRWRCKVSVTETECFVKAGHQRKNNSACKLKLEVNPFRQGQEQKTAVETPLASCAALLA